MDVLLWTGLIAVATWVLGRVDERQRIGLLSAHLAPFSIEKTMEQIMEGYLRAMGESDTQRRDSVMAVLAGSEALLCSQFRQLAQALAREPASRTWMSTLAFPPPFVARWWPGARLDVRALMNLHARAIEDAIDNVQQLDGPARAFRVSAELLLMQHTCHWFCKSRAVASVRLLARHTTALAQVLAAVAPSTRLAYRALTGQPLTESA
jgi:hypothetical protein